MGFSTERRTVLSGLAGLAVTLPLAACGGAKENASGNGPEKTGIKVGALPVVDFAALWVAQQHGLFAKQGLKVTIEVLAGGAAAVPRLAAESLDFSIINYVSAIQATQTRTAPMKILLDAYQLDPGAAAIVVPGDSPIRKPADLKGKRVSVNTKGNVPQLLIDVALKRYGVVLPDSAFSEVDFPQLVAALKSHSIDAAWAVEPFVTVVKQALGGRVVVDLAQGAAANFPIGAFTTTQKFAKENPKTTAAFTAALTQAEKMLAGDESLVRKTLPTYAKIDKKTASAIHIAKFPGSVSKQRVQHVADLMTQYGFLKQHFDASSML